MASESSLSRRLLLAASAFIAVAMIVAAVAIGFALHRFIQGQIDQRLDTQITFLTSLLRAAPDRTLSLAGSADGPPFERRRRGWYWQIDGVRNALRSQSLDGETLAVPDRPLPPRPKDDRPAPADGIGPEDERLHFRVKTVTLSGGAQATIVASAPRAAVLGPLRDAMVTLGLSLTVLGLALIAAMLLQVRLGLRPLERLRGAIADVRSGVIARVPDTQPREVRPVVVELNALLDQNATHLERARGHVANLAHGLKTPLSTLMLALSSDAKAGDQNLLPLAELMERRIRHHLGRARTAAMSGPVRARTVIAPRLADLGDALAKIHSGKAIALALDVAPAQAVACEQQDFDEMAGNLMENAFIWATGRIAVRAEQTDTTLLRLLVDDDGPGLRSEDLPQLLHPGARLDESIPGYGFGLSITRELAELYGGSLSFGRSALGGLQVVLMLPVAAAVPDSVHALK